METETLYVKNFGPIKDAQITVRKLTIFIGESGSGKSVMMKLLSLFRWMYKRVSLRSYLQHANIKKTGIGFKIIPLMRTSGISEFLSSDTEITYIRGKYTIKLENKSVNIRFKIAKEDLSLEKICFISDKRAMASDFLAVRLDRRSANYYLQDTVENITVALNQLEEINIESLNAKLRMERGGLTNKNVKVIGDSYNIKFENSSSGMQNVAPISAILEYYANHFDAIEDMNSSIIKFLADSDKLKNFRTSLNVGEIGKRNVHIIIEEPELSLSPKKQILLSKELARKCFGEHKTKSNVSLTFATHSPYFLTAFNNMILAGDTKSADVPNVMFDEVSAYEITDGTAKDMRNEENRLLNADPIDDASNEIEEEFDSLLSL